MPLVKVKSFLQQKYELERLTVNQIANLTMSSRSTVKKYLREANIPLRPEDTRIGSLGYGERKLNGRIVQNKAELHLIERVKSLRANGLAVGKIAELLQTLGLPTKRGGKWDRKTIYTILKRITKN